jgi:monofunctional biosynthetic peptidoglycan transglycosylase
MRLRNKILLGSAASVLIMAGLLVREVSTLPPIDQLPQRLAARYAATIHSTWMPLVTISTRLRTAVVVWEDPAFYHHSGLSWGGLRQAFLADVRAGGYVRGGSTITQQVAKNLFLSPEKTLRRKVREALLAWQLERTLTKQQILEIYLNIADWGDGITGAEAASRLYFAKSAEDLSWTEAALLAGMLPNPHRITPFRAPEQALQQRHQVLLKLLLFQELSPEEFHEADACQLTGAVADTKPRRP